jgi:hypothetical protein
VFVLMRVQLFRGGGRQPWYVRLVSQNGQVLSVSEGYATKWNAKRAARRMFPGLPLVEVAG